MTKEAAQQHASAAEHYEEAAKAHRKAAEAYQAGDPKAGAFFAVVADGHAADAEEAKLDAHKEHRDEYGTED